jgi:DNA polymerase I
MSYASWDCETTIRTSFKRKANPFDPANWVVTNGVKHKGEATVVETRFGKERPTKGWLGPVLRQANGEWISLLIGMNIKFDLHHALQDPDNLLMWMEYVARGGMVWDIQLAEYLLCGQEQASQMLSLDEIAVRYGGNVKIDEVKALWNAGIDTPDIEPILLTRYLCGGLDETGTWQMGDVENTEHVALKQIARARACGQLNSIMLNMGALLYTVEAERNGMFVDKPLGMTMAAELQVEVDKMHKELERFLPTLPPEFEFNWNSRFHKSALIFGGVCKYDAYEYALAAGGTVLKQDRTDEPLAYSQMDAIHWLLKDGSLTAVDPFDTEDTTQYVMYASGKQAGEYKTKKVKVNNLDKPKGRMVKAEFHFPGYTTPEKKWESSDKGVYSTAAEVIEELGTRDVPFLKVFAALQSMAKDLGTYFYTIDDEGKEAGMLTLVDAFGVIHHSLNMVATITARLSSSNPNLQNIPKGNKSDVKLLFKSRFKDGKVIQSDFSSLEVYVQAILTQCKQLIADLKAGLDLHCVRLAAKEKMDYQEVVNLCKGYTNAHGVFVPAEKVWDYKRTGAKRYSFQRAFGAGNKKIADSTGMTLEEVEELSEAEDKRYPEINAYYENVTLSIKGSRKPLRTLPHPDIPGVICNLGTSYFRTPDGKLYTYREQPAPDYSVKRGVYASFSPTEIKNYVVQGTGGEWAKAAMYLTVRSFYARRNFGGLALIVNQVHDAEYVDADPKVALEAAALLHACMEAASDYMEWRFKWMIPVPVPSDTTWGASMMDEDSIEGLRELATPLRTQLREQYMGGYKPSYLN